MSTAARLGRFLGLGRDGSFFECRRCGSTLTSRDRECPQCGSDSIASYEL